MILPLGLCISSTLRNLIYNVEVQNVKQRPTNFCCEGSETKYFRPCGPHVPCLSCQLSYSTDTAATNRTNNKDQAVLQPAIFTKIGLRLDLVHRPWPLTHNMEHQLTGISVTASHLLLTCCRPIILYFIKPVLQNLLSKLLLFN